MSRARRELVASRLRRLGTQIQDANLHDLIDLIHSYVCWLSDNVGPRIRLEGVPNQYINKNDFRRGGITEWQLEFIAREALSKTNFTGRSDPKQWIVFASMIHSSMLATQSLGRPTSDPTLIINRVAYQQFPWQANRENQVTARTLFIFSKPELMRLVRCHHGLSLSDIIQLTYGIVGSFSAQCFRAGNTEFRFEGINVENTQRFVSRLCSPIEDVQKELCDKRSLDEDMIYSFSPFLEFPIIEFPGSNQIVCPFPMRLWQRCIEGLYYDCLREAGRQSEDFNRHLGDAFEEFILFLLREKEQRPDEVISGDIGYGTAQRPNRTCDVFWSGTGQPVLIECKARKLRVDIRNSDQLTDQLKLSLNVIVEGVVKLHETVLHSLQNKFQSPIPLNGTIFGLVVTMDEWIMLARSWTEYVDAEISRRLDAINIPENVRSRVHWRAISSEDFDRLVFVMKELNSDAILHELTGNQRWDHPTNTILDHIDENQLIFQPANIASLEILMQ